MPVPSTKRPGDVRRSSPFLVTTVTTVAPLLVLFASMLNFSFGDFLLDWLIALDMHTGRPFSLDTRGLGCHWKGFNCSVRALAQAE